MVYWCGERVDRWHDSCDSPMSRDGLHSHTCDSCGGVLSSPPRASDTITRAEVSSMNTYKSTADWKDYQFDITKVVFAERVEPNSLSYLFQGLTELKEVTGFSNVKLAQGTSLYGLFAGCMKLETVNVNELDTSLVTNLGGLFLYCSGLTSVNLDKLNTSNCSVFDNMFAGCSMLTSLDLRNFNTTKATSMASMFSGCSSLTSLDVSSFSTSKVTNFHRMFDGCESLSEIDVSRFQYILSS